MEHKLRVLVRLDVDPSSAVLEVSGCLTADTWQTLEPLKASSLVHGQRITLDLGTAQHVEAAAVSLLQKSDAVAAHNVRIICPGTLPACPRPGGKESKP